MSTPTEGGDGNTQPSQPETSTSGNKCASQLTNKQKGSRKFSRFYKMSFCSYIKETQKW